MSITTRWLPAVLAFLALPGVVAFLVPLLLARLGGGPVSAWALVLLVPGVVLLVWSARELSVRGRGTLAPWDPTRRLVAVGPYRHVRNPMITGVAAVLAAQALFAGSWMLAAWLGAFALINHTYFIVSEEPGLARRFGASYEEYRSAVPRWIPRLRPWSAPDEAGRTG